MTRTIWRGRSDWVPLTDAELAHLRHLGYAPKRVPVQRGDVILWRSDVVHCGAPPLRPTQAFRAVSYTCMLPAVLTPPAVRATKLRDYALGLSGDHRPNVAMPHLSSPKKQSHHKTVRGQEVVQPVQGAYFKDVLPRLTWRQAELYGCVEYGCNGTTSSSSTAVRGEDGRLYWEPSDESLENAKAIPGHVS